MHSNPITKLGEDCDAEAAICVFIAENESMDSAEATTMAATEQIDAAIQGHITMHRDKLLGNVSGIRELQGDCAALSVAVQEVKRSVQRISRELREPFDGIRARTE